MTDIGASQTPCLLLDESRMARNIARLKNKLGALGVSFRPHLKTCKSVEIAERLLDGSPRTVTVSTLKEARYFADAGFHDIVYAVGIAPAKLAAVAAIRESGADLTVILDSVSQAQAVAEFCASRKTTIPVLIEIDTDGHRSGVKPESPVLLDIAHCLMAGGAELRGVIAHAGASYHAYDARALVTIAERERAQTVNAAARLRKAGFPCPIVSIGSTPTAHFAGNLNGVSEVRAGVFVFFDLVMAGIGVCAIDDIALSVLTTVIGHRDDGAMIVDAGWMAMSRDRGTAAQSLDQGYGLIADLDGAPIGDLILQTVSQEHGIVAPRAAGKAVVSLPVGSLLRIYPNHACATAAQFDNYDVLVGRTVIARWSRIRGW